MKRSAVVATVLILATIPVASVLAAKPRAHAAPAVAADPPTVSSMAPLLAQFRWGSNHQAVVRIFNQTGGIFDQDYNPRLARMQPGVTMQSVEAERDNRKAAFANSFVPFNDTPTGFDNTSIRGEFSYRNHEAVMYVDRHGVRRYFFFIGAPPSDRLWKIFDDVPYKANGLYGANFQQAVTKLNIKLNAPARIRVPDATNGLKYATADWQDGRTHLRAEDRGSSVAVVMEERATLNALPQLRANKEIDPLALDPTIAAITHHRISDPNAYRNQDAGAPKKDKHKH